MMGLAGECIHVGLSWAGCAAGGFHSHDAHHSMIFMALITASGLLAPLVSPLSQALFAGLSCLSVSHWPYSRSYLANPTRQTSSAQHLHPASASRLTASEQTLSKVWGGLTIFSTCSWVCACKGVNPVLQKPFFFL